MTSHDGSWGVLGEPGRSVFFITRRAHLLTTCPQGRRWYCRVASGARSARRIALSAESTRQCRRACGQRSPLSARSGSVRRSTPPAKTCTRQLYRRGRPSQKFGLLSLLRKRNRKRKYGGDSDWQYTTWKRKSSAEAQAGPHAQHQLI